MSLPSIQSASYVSEIPYRHDFQQHKSQAARWLSVQPVLVLNLVHSVKLDRLNTISDPISK